MSRICNTAERYDKQARQANDIAKDTDKDSETDKTVSVCPGWDKQGGSVLTCLLVGRYFFVRKRQKMEHREGGRETDYKGYALNLDGKMYNVGETDCG
jgi:hypothetical protein